MPFTYTEIAATGDVLANNRHTLYLPSLPDVIEGKELTLRHTSVTMPTLNIGHIIVKQLGWSLAFAGIRTQENTFNVEFVETQGAPVIKALTKWQDICAGFKTHLSRRKSDYAVNCECKAYDTVGETALIVKMYNVWPVTVTYGQYSEESGPSMVQVVFSVDAIDITDVVYADQDFEKSLPTSRSNPDLWYESRSGVGFSSGNVGNFNMFDSVVKQLGINSNNVQSVLGRYF
jgi:hypothetical protein